MTLQQAADQARHQPHTAIRPAAFAGSGVGLIWEPNEAGWIGWDFRGLFPRVIVDEYRLLALGFAVWQIVSIEQLRAEGEIFRMAAK